MDDTTKHQVRDGLLAQLSGELTSTDDTIHDEGAAAELDQDSSFTPDDASQADAAGVLHSELEDSAARREQTLAKLRGLDLAPADTVRPGALVKVDGHAYLVAVSSEPVEVDGTSYAGLSTDSPLYEAIRGTKAGETVTFRDRSVEVESVR